VPVRTYVYDGAAVLQEADGGGTTQATYTRTGGGYGDLLSHHDGSSARYYEPDALGSTDALADDAQAVSDRWAYQAFGAATQTTGSDPTPFTWVGRQGYFADAQTGMYLLGSGTRHYDPQTAQFLSVDPFGFASGDVNLYRYVSNSPTNFSDPSGTGTITWPYFCVQGRVVCVGTCTCSDPGNPGWLIHLSVSLAEELCCAASCIVGNKNKDAQPGAMTACLQRVLRAGFGPGLTCDCS
jgi:RHS repeat-associated protein